MFHAKVNVVYRRKIVLYLIMKIPFSCFLDARNNFCPTELQSTYPDVAIYFE